MRLQRRFQSLLTHAADAKDEAGSLKRMLWRRSSLIRATPMRTVLGSLLALDNSSSIASLRAFLFLCTASLSALGFSKQLLADQTRFPSVW
jgi:hypothetical protein